MKYYYLWMKNWSAHQSQSAVDMCQCVWQLEITLQVKHMNPLNVITLVLHNAYL